MPEGNEHGERGGCVLPEGDEHGERDGCVLPKGDEHGERDGCVLPKGGYDQERSGRGFAITEAEAEASTTFKGRPGCGLSRPRRSKVDLAAALTDCDARGERGESLPQSLAM